MTEYEPYWVTEKRPLTPEEMVQRIQRMTATLAPVPVPGSKNLFGETMTEERIRADLRLAFTRLANMATAFVKKLEDQEWSA